MTQLNCKDRETKEKMSEILRRTAKSFEKDHIDSLKAEFDNSDSDDELSTGEKDHQGGDRIQSDDANQRKITESDLINAYEHELKKWLPWVLFFNSFIF